MFVDRRPGFALLVMLIGLFVALPLMNGGIDGFGRALVQLIGLSGWMVAAWMLRRGTLQPSCAFFEARWIFIGIGLFQFITLLQLLPLPLDLLRVIAPGSAKAWQSIEALNLADGAFYPISVHPHQTFDELILGLGYLGVLYCLLAVVNSPERIRTLLLAFLLGSALVAFIGVLHRLVGLSVDVLVWHWGASDTMSGGFGSFLNKNHYASFVGISACLSFGYLLGHLRKYEGRSVREHLLAFLRFLLSPKMVLRLGIVVLVIALVLSRSRMGNTAFFISLVVTALISLTSARLNRRLVGLVFATVLAIDALVIGAWFGIDVVVQRIEGTVAISQSITGQQEKAVNKSTAAGVTDWVEIKDPRPRIVENAVELARIQPWVGFGAGTFVDIYPMVRQVDEAHRQNHAHNDYVQFVAESGLGAVLVLALTASWIFVILMRALHGRRSRTALGLIIGAISALVMVLIHMGFEFVFQTPAIVLSILFVVAMGLLGSFDRTPSRRDRRPL